MERLIRERNGMDLKIGDCIADYDKYSNDDRQDIFTHRLASKLKETLALDIETDMDYHASTHSYEYLIYEKMGKGWFKKRRRLAKVRNFNVFLPSTEFREEIAKQVGMLNNVISDKYTVGYEL